jgi:putative ABC transport system permease protein
VLFGYELAPDGLPDEPPGLGEAYADDSLRAEGVEEGTVIRLGPARSEVRVIGFLADSQYSGQGSLWGSLDTWRQVLDANRPSARVGVGTVQALVVRDAPGRTGDDLTAAIDTATGGVTDSYTIAGAIDALPGLSQQRSTFNQIIGLTVVIAVVVVALFFALLTVERTGLYGVLKALGAGSGTLFAGVLLQAVIVTAVASAFGVAFSLLLDAVIPAGSIPFAVTPARLASSVAALLLAAVLGVAFSLRRVLRVDPASAIGGAP